MSRVEVNERSVALVGLDHVVVAGAVHRVRVEPVDLAADEKGRARGPCARASWRSSSSSRSCRACRRRRSCRAPRPDARASWRAATPVCPRLRASASSGFVSGIAEETTTTCGSPRFSAAWPMATGTPAASKRTRVARLLQVAAGDAHAALRKHERDAAHAGPASTDEVRIDLLRQRSPPWVDRGFGFASNACRTARELRDRGCRMGPAQGARRVGHGSTALRVAEQPDDDVTEAFPVQLVVADELCCTVRDHRRRVLGLVVVGRVGVRHEHRRQPKAVISAIEVAPARATTRSAAASAEPMSST